MTRINTNISSLTAQNSLRKSNDALGTALSRLSTGLRINTGKDDPAGLIASEQLRSEIASIGQSIKNSERAGNIIATADAALGEVSSLLNDVRTLVQSSANKGAISAEEIAANQVQVDNALDAITRISQTTVFGGQKLLNGTKSFSVSGSLGAFNSPSDIKVNSFDPTLHTPSANNDVSLTVTRQATKKSVTLNGTDYNTGTSNSLLDLSRGTSTSTKTTLVSNDFSLADATSSLASLSTGSARYTRVIEGSAGGFADLGGTTGDDITFNVQGNLGTVAVTVDVGALKADSTALVSAINAVSSQTGVIASGSGSGGDVTLVSSLVGTSGTTATLTATAGDYAGTASTRVIDGSAIGATITSTGSINFNVVAQGGTTAVTVNAEDIDAGQGGSLQNLVDAINNTVGIDVTAVLNGTDIELTATGVGNTPITVTVTGGTASVGDRGALTTAVSNGSAVTGTNTDVAEFNAAITGSAVTAGSNGSLASKTTAFTITGNKGSAVISTAALAAGGLTGNDVIINNDRTTDAGLQAFADLINSRTDSTGVIASVNATTHNVELTSQGVGSASTAGIAVATAGADQTLIASSSTKSTQTGNNGTSNTTTLELIGDLGRAVITVNNDAVINDSTVLRNAINAVTTQTGLIASGGGFGTGVTLTASKYGSDGIVTVNALAASNSADISLINSSTSRVTVDGIDATGTISHSKGGSTFTADGERFTYTDDAISLEGNLDPSLTPAVRATTTIQKTTAGAGGIDSLTGTGVATIDFQLSGTVNGVAVNTTISGVNVAALKNDSQYLVDKINATSTASGVQAAVGTGGNIVLSATTAGSGGTVGITSTGSTNGTDDDVFNNSDSFTATVAGSDPSVGNNFDVTGGALFQIGPTVNFSNQINVNITSLDLATLGRNYTTTGNKGLSALKSGGTDSLDKADLSDASKLIEQAISQNATLRGQLGAIQKNAIDSNIRSLQTSLEQVTSAESSIRDADFAVETAALTRSQILVQAGTSVLALANQSPQNVLSLLQR